MSTVWVPNDVRQRFPIFEPTNFMPLPWVRSQTPNNLNNFLPPPTIFQERHQFGYTDDILPGANHSLLNNYHSNVWASQEFRSDFRQGFPIETSKSTPWINVQNPNLFPFPPHYNKVTEFRFTNGIRASPKESALPDLMEWVSIVNAQKPSILPWGINFQETQRLGYGSRVELEPEPTPHQQISLPVVLKMAAGSLYLPKDEPEKPQGDDAHFVCMEAQTLGVADGVGGWSKKGIDSGQYAREIMINANVAALCEPKGEVNPKRVLQQAFSNTRAEGASTACIITLSGHVLKASNIGDSGFVVLRGGKVVYHSPVQQHYFNCPYQLGKRGEDPKLAQELEVEVEAGDVVIAGTDGLFDNMDELEIEEYVKLRTSTAAGGAHVQPEELASAIANLALYNSFDRFADTPFARASRKSGENFRGGKVDDITVVVAFIEASN